MSSAMAEAVPIWRIGTVLCQPKIDETSGEPDVHSGLGYANVWPNHGATYDDYHDIYCPIYLTSSSSVNRLEITADLGDANNDIYAYLFRCSYINQYCTAVETYHIYTDYGMYRYHYDFGASYALYLGETADDFYYFVEVRLYDGDTGDSDIPRAYWVGLYWNSAGESASAESGAGYSDTDPFPECADGCYGDCSFLSHPDDEFWEHVDWELEWRDYCRDPSLEETSLESVW